MNIGKNIKELRKQKGLLQKQVAIDIGIGISYYNKIENGQREPSIKVLDQLAKLFGISIDNIVHPDNSNNELPKEVKVADKGIMERLRLIEELAQNDKNVLFSLIDTMLTKKKFKDFFEKQLAA